MLETLKLKNLCLGLKQGIGHSHVDLPVLQAPGLGLARMRPAEARQLLAALASFVRRAGGRSAVGAPGAAGGASAAAGAAEGGAAEGAVPSRAAEGGAAGRTPRGGPTAAVLQQLHALAAGLQVS